MTTNEQWARMMEEHEITFLRGDLATSSPQSYMLDEKMHRKRDAVLGTKCIVVNYVKRHTQHLGFAQGRSGSSTL